MALTRVRFGAGGGSVFQETIIIQYLTLEDRFILSPPFINPMSGWRKHPSSCNLAWTPGIVGAIESIPLCFEAFRHSQAVRLVVIAEPSWVLQPRVWHAFAQSLHSFCETFGCMTPHIRATI
ncbi:hypothetical protein AcV7_003515 [Taiwanofungus camphoratus]|nr:hypothetical protein AcV7_003515 [Antrodia cinnamomea]